MFWKTSGVITLSLWLAVVSASQAAPSFGGLGDLMDGAFDSTATGVSADGSVVVGTGTSASGSEAFRWTEETGIVGLGTFQGGVSSSASAVSDDGSIVIGTSVSATRGDAFRWVQGNGMASLGITGGFGTNATGVSGNGAVVSVNFRSASFATSSFALRWTSGSGTVNLFGPTAPSLERPVAVASAVSQDGGVIVGFHQDPLQGSLAVRWDGTTPATLTLGTANGVSADGSVVVGTQNVNNQAFRWTGQTGSILLGDLDGGAVDSQALAVSGDGSIVVGVGNTDSGDEAFIWDQEHGIRSLMDVLVTDFNLGSSLAGWTLQSANAISADGLTIVGSGLNPSRDPEAWRVNLIPEPTSAALLGFTSLALLSRRRRAA